MRLPHPIPYQGSKRALASRILERVRCRRFRTLYEPFAGSGAFTLAAAQDGLADAYVLSDALEPLMGIWRGILEDPQALAQGYGRLWEGQARGGDDYFLEVREAFNQDSDPAKLLYLLARCVKNAPRFNTEGRFNQSHDRRRLGVAPERMRREILGASGLLSGRTTARAGDFETMIQGATGEDLVYLDPPWQGTSRGKDRRYFEGLSRERLISVLEDLRRRGVPFLLSYDGICGGKSYGEPLPAHLGLGHVYLDGGRSSQSTLVGRAEVTLESLYCSEDLDPQGELGA